MSESFADGVTAPEPKDETQTEDYLSNLVGEGKKYSSVEEAAQALAKKAVNADTFIETLKTEKQQLESQYNELQTRNRSIDEIVNALQTPAPSQIPEPRTEEQPQVINVQEEVAKVLSERDKEQERQKRIADAWDKLSDSFGGLDTAKTAVASYINGDETKKGLIDTLAISDPDALVKILKPASEQTTFSEPTSGVRTPAATGTMGRLTWEDVQRVRKEDPKLYNSKDFKQRMHNEL